jgi:hypothetical protein
MPYTFPCFLSQAYIFGIFMATTPLREKVQLWFHFLCLAHKSKDPDLQAVLEANSEKYADWGDFKNLTWTAWWKDHAFLFYVERMIQLKPGTVVPPNRFVFSIPLDRTKAQATEIFKAIYAKMQSEIGQAEKPKFKFSVNQKNRKEHLVYAEKMRTYLQYAKEVYLPIMNTGSNVSADEILKKAVIALEKIRVRKRSTQRGRAKNALLEQVKVFGNTPNAFQQIKRMNMYVENILFNVAAGEFPGVYNVKRKKPKLKIVSRKIAVMASAPTKNSMSTKKKKQSDYLYDSWSPARRAANEKGKIEKEIAKKLNQKGS